MNLSRKRECVPCGVRRGRVRDTCEELAGVERHWGGSAKGEVSVKVTDRLLMNINIKSDGTYLIATRLGEQSHGRTGARVFLRSRKTHILELMEEGSFGFWQVIDHALY